MGDLDPCNKRFVDTKLDSVSCKEKAKPAKTTIYSFAVNQHCIYFSSHVCTDKNYYSLSAHEKREERGSHYLVYNGRSVACTSDQH